MNGTAPLRLSLYSKPLRFRGSFERQRSSATSFVADAIYYSIPLIMEIVDD